MPTYKINSNSETGCCPRFDPAPWEKKEIIMKDRLFMKEHVSSFMHIPINFGKVMKRSMEKITAAGALSLEPLMLSDENSLWGSDIYIAVSKEVPKSNNVRISGTFLSRVFEGQYKDMGKWIKEMNEYVRSQKKDSKKTYFFYTTCPACAKHYGKNYVVLLAQI